MNQVIEQFSNRTSIRKFKSKSIPKDIIDAIFSATQQAPSWINGQQLSIIRITDPEKRKKMKSLAGNQAHVEQAAEFWVFCVDFYRVNIACEMEGKPFAVQDNIDLLIVGTTDVGIALGTATAAAESYGLGTVAIGGVRRSPEEVIELLELPQYVYPISGLCIGYPDEQPMLKPRLPKHAIIFENAYETKLHNEIKAYNQTITDYMIARSNGEQQTNWASGIASFYAEPQYRNNSYAPAEPILKKQGFLSK